MPLQMDRLACWQCQSCVDQIMQMQLSVEHGSVAATPGSCHVRYNIRFELDCSDCPEISVVVASTIAPGVDARTLEKVRESIREGFVRVLEPKTMGAAATVHDLVIDEFELMAGRYAAFTAHELEYSLTQLLESDPLSCWPYARVGLIWLFATFPLYIIGLHPSSPWIVSTVALLAGTYLIISKCIPNFAIAAIHHSVKSEVQNGRDDFR
jgi:hypothetical protein